MKEWLNKYDNPPDSPDLKIMAGLELRSLGLYFPMACSIRKSLLKYECNKILMEISHSRANLVQ
jgi:hypothetical protein